MWVKCIMPSWFEFVERMGRMVLWQDCMVMEFRRWGLEGITILGESEEYVQEESWILRNERNVYLKKTLLENFSFIGIFLLDICSMSLWKWHWSIAAIFNILISLSLCSLFMGVIEILWVWWFYMQWRHVHDSQCFAIEDVEATLTHWWTAL